MGMWPTLGNALCSPSAKSIRDRTMEREEHQPPTLQRCTTDARSQADACGVPTWRGSALPIPSLEFETQHAAGATCVRSDSVSTCHISTAHPRMVGEARAASAILVD